MLDPPAFVSHRASRGRQRPGPVRRTKQQVPDIRFVFCVMRVNGVTRGASRNSSEFCFASVFTIDTYC